MSPDYGVGKSPTSRLEQLERENAELRADLERQSRRLGLLCRPRRHHADLLNVAPLIEQVLADVLDAIEVDGASIHLAADGWLLLAGLSSRIPGFSDDNADFTAELPIDGSSIQGQAARERRTIIMSASASGGDSVRELYPSLGVEHVAAVPLVAQGQMLGVFVVLRREHRPFMFESLRVLEAAAERVAVAVEYARLYGEERLRVDELSLISEVGGLIARHVDLPSVLSVGVRRAARILGVPNVFLLLQEGDVMKLSASTGDLAECPADKVLSMDEPSAVTHAITTRKPVVIHDPQDPRMNWSVARHFKYRAIMVVPLIARGEPIGGLVFGDSTEGRRFERRDVERATALGNQLATGIVSARLYDEGQRRVEELNVMLDVGRVITASLNLEEILEAAAIGVVKLVDATDSFIWLRDPNTEQLFGVMTSATELREHFRGVRLEPNATSLASRAVAARAPVQARDAIGSTDVNSLLNARYSMKSLLALPLMVRDEPIGAVVIGDRHRVRSWLPAEVERATVVAGQVAVSVANARLFEDLRTSYDELEKAQQALVERERLAAIGELAALVAHEVRNPLAIIYNSLVSLRRLVRPEGDVGVLLDILREESVRLNQIVGDLLDFGRPHDPKLRLESLETIVHEAFETVRSVGIPDSVELRWQGPATLPMVLADARLLRQAFINLIMNGAQAMPKGGAVVVRAVEDGPDIVLEISDQGTGISEALLSQIFQPFFTTRATGTGLGLAVVKRIIDSHHAHLRVSSVPGAGTTFYVRIPSGSERSGK